MTTSTAAAAWSLVDEGWGRRAADFATLSEPANCREAPDVRALSETGWTDRQIFAITAFVALRIAFSTVIDALGARPDAQYRSVAPPAVLKAITYGRPLAD